MIYSAINIGPIVQTLDMARKPRELWAASFLFSHLMKCIYDTIKSENIEIISPAQPQEEVNQVGIYPDRIYAKGCIDAKNILVKALSDFYSDLYGMGGKGSNNPNLDYFNLMSATCETNKESEAIAQLNQKLDVMELCHFANDNNTSDSIYEIISKKGRSTLFEIGTGKMWFRIPDLSTIANTQSKKKEDMKSHHKYFCVVQADGDNVGKTVSHKDLEDGKVMEISKALVNFGLSATKLVKKFGGQPIYAGGDDLLFIAPVIGKEGEDIFCLLERIENEAFKDVEDIVSKQKLRNDGDVIHASLSFGVSISYNKHPLYEALEAARDLLFNKAKKVKEKKAIAWSLRKHSGGTFEAVFSLNNDELRKRFRELVKETVDNDIVSAVAHKIRENEGLVQIVLESNNSEGRLDALFEKILEFDEKKKNYFNAVKALMPVLYKTVGKEDFIQTLYTLLRTAKFIKGEELHDE